jgi:hypothetical protein
MSYGQSAYAELSYADSGGKTVIVQLATAGSAAMSAAIASSFRVGLLKATMAMVATRLQVTHLKDLQGLAIAMAAQPVSLFKQRIDAGAMAMVSASLTKTMTSLLGAAPITMVAAPLPLKQYKMLAKASSMAMAAFIDLRMKQLISAGSMAMAAAPLQHANVVGLLSVSAAVTAAAVQKQHAYQLAVAAMQTVAVGLGHANVIDLSSTNVLMQADPLDGLDVSAAWTAPTDTFAMSRYDDLPPGLLGIASGIGGTLLIDKTGVGQRGGTTDYGAQIDEAVKTGLMDFRSEKLKNLGDLYFSYSSTKGIAIDVGETSTGVELTYSYNAPALNASAQMPMRVQEGRGIESRHRRYTIRNVAGDKLSLRGFRAILNDMSRRF